MKTFRVLVLMFLLVFCANPAFCADNLVVPDTPPKQTKTKKPLYYHQKSDEKNITLKEANASKDESKNITVNNVKLNNSTDRVIFESSSKISAIYPKDTAANNFPGYRGPNQLVIYTRDFAQTTGTNEFGKEAVVVNNIVVALTGANSSIPRNGYVISGHGSAKKWISDNLKIGTKIEIQGRTIRAYTTLESFRYCAKAKIDEVQNILISTKSDYVSRNDKLIYYHLKRAKQKYKKSKKDNSDSALECAKEAQFEASLAFRYTIPYIKNEFRGTWIRPTSKNIADIQKILDKIQDTGINNVFLETYFHGRTIFPSRVMKEYGFEEQNSDFSGVDILAVWLKEAHKRNIKVHCWFESFYVGNKSPDLNPKSILAIKPEWMNRTKQKADFEGWVSHPQEHNGYFLDPANPEVTTFLLKLLGELSARYNIDGLNIDYVRYPNIAKENYNNQWGYTKAARDEFMLLNNIDPIELTKDDELWEEWCNYRADKVTGYIRRASDMLKNRDIMFSAVIFPDYKVSLKTKYQDWAKWVNLKYIDALTPLILTSDDELAKSMLEEIKKKSEGHANLYPGLFAGFIESDPEDLLKQIHTVRKLKLNGVILFDWAHLSDNYLDVLKTSAFRESQLK